MLALVVAWHGGVAGMPRWPEQQAVFLAMNASFAALPASLWSALTLLGDATVLLPLLALFLLRAPQVWAAMLATVPVAGLLSVLTKHWASVPRPAAVLDHGLFNMIGPALQVNSFPSGHSITAFATAAAGLATLAPMPRRGREWLLLAAGVLAAVAIALSRIAVGAHWPLDLVAGAAGGWLAGLSGAALARHTGWWRWLIFGTGQRAACAGLLIWGLLLLLQPHDAMASAVVRWLAGSCGVAAALGLLLAGKSARPSVRIVLAATPVEASIACDGDRCRTDPP